MGKSGRVQIGQTDRAEITDISGGWVRTCRSSGGCGWMWKLWVYMDKDRQRWMGIDGSNDQAGIGDISSG